MKNIISLLFVSILASSFIIGCGSSGGDSDGGSGGVKPTVNAPGSSDPLSTNIASSGNENKPKVVPACETGDSVPGCS